MKVRIVDTHVAPKYAAPTPIDGLRVRGESASGSGTGSISGLGTAGNSLPGSGKDM